MDKKAIYNLSYGVFMLSTRSGEKVNGCITNTCMQVAGNPVRVAISVLNTNYTCDLLKESGIFALSILDQTCSFATIKHFGFQSGRDVDKFADLQMPKDCNDIPYMGYHTQLNPTISYLHEPGVRRFSLCLDVAEIFKPLIGDRLLFSLLNRNQITEKSFTKELNYLHLNRDASRLIAQELEKKLQQTIMHKDLGRPVTYQYLMRLELYKLIKHLIGEKEYEGFRIWW